MLEPVKEVQNKIHNKIQEAGDLSHIALGERLLSEGKMGTIVLAGGQGSRLGFNHPKGMYPISPVKEKTLFQLLAEKTLAASQKYGRPLFLAIMTSPDNDQETRAYFKAHALFGLKPEQLHFFVQGELPMEDLAGKALPILASDGNGGVFAEFVRQNLASLWEAAGVEWINIVLIDNPLADPFDSNLLGFAAERQLEVAVKCCRRRSPEEKVGLLFKKEGKLKVVEYFELKEEERALGELANLSLFCLSLSFVKALAAQDFPIHRAQKPLPTEPGAPPAMGWKLEKFIFDLLLFTSKSDLIVYPRELCFAPLKNRQPPDSPQTVREALEKRDLFSLQNLTGIEQKLHPFELSAPFLYPTEALKAQFKGVELDPGTHYLV